MDHAEGLSYHFVPVSSRITKKILQRYQIELHPAQVPLATHARILLVFARVLLDRHIGQMHGCVLEILRAVSLVREPAKGLSVQIQRQRLIARAEQIDPHIELFPADQQWVVDVFLDDVGVGLRVVRDPRIVVFSLLDLRDFVEQKYPLALRLADGLHDPDGFWVPLVFFVENGVFSWEVVGDWEEVHSGG